MCLLIQLSTVTCHELPIIGRKYIIKINVFTGSGYTKYEFK